MGMIERKCLKCNEILFHCVVFKDGLHTGQHWQTPLELESDEKGRFYTCPHCKAKNAVTDETGPKGESRLRISQIRD